MRLRKEDFQVKRIPQSASWDLNEQKSGFETDAGEAEKTGEMGISEIQELESGTEELAVVTVPANKFAIDVNARKLAVTLGIIFLMFVAPAIVFSSGSNLLGLNQETNFSQAVVLPTGQVAGVQLDLSDSSQTTTTSGEVLGESSVANSDTQASLTFLGQPIGTVMIILGLVLVTVPVVILLKS